MAVYGSEAAREHADRWLAAWNAHDLDAIMAGYAEDVEFIASTVRERWERPDGRLQGREMLRRHFRRGLDLAPSLRFDELRLLANPAGYALLYRRDNGNTAWDVVELDASGLASRVNVFYEGPQA